MHEILAQRDTQLWKKFSEQFASFPQISLLSDVHTGREIGFFEWQNIMQKGVGVDGTLVTEVAVPVGTWGYAYGAGPCSLCIVHGDASSTRWINGHLKAGRGFTDEAVIQDALLYMQGQLHVMLFGGTTFDYSQLKRVSQIQEIKKQLMSCNIAEDQISVHTFWNPINTSCINQAALVNNGKIEQMLLEHMTLC